MKKHSKNVIFRILEIFIIAIWIFPLVWMVITSLKYENEVVTRAFTFLPQNPTLHNYQEAFGSTYTKSFCCK